MEDDGNGNIVDFVIIEDLQSLNDCNDSFTNEIDINLLTADYDAVYNGENEEHDSPETDILFE